MVFKATSLNNARRRRSGMTLVEMMVAMLIASLLVIVIAGSMMFGARSFVFMGNYVDLDRQSRNALDRMLADVRQAAQLTDYDSKLFVKFRDSDNGVLKFVYDPDKKTLTRDKDGVAEILLRGCESIQFEIFQRTPKAGSFDEYETATLSDCKLLRVQWTCARSVLGFFNTESVQTARIVMRNHKLL